MFSSFSSPVYPYATFVPQNMTPTNINPYYANNFKNHLQANITVNTSLPAQWPYVHAPKAAPAPGVLNEGTWPRMVLYEGFQVLMKRDEWEQLKLEGTHICSIPAQGMPTAIPIPDEVPDLDDDDDESDTSSDGGTATPRGEPSSPIVAPPQPFHEEILRPGSPMESVVSRVYSSMSVDAVSIVRSSASHMSVDAKSEGAMSIESNIFTEYSTPAEAMDTSSSNSGRPTGPLSEISSNLPPNKFGKRAKAPHSEELEGSAARAAKRQHMMVERSRHARSHARHARRQQRAEYEHRRRELREQIQLEEIRAMEAARQADVHRAAEHARDLSTKRARLLEMEREEEAARIRREAVERDRRAAIEAQAQKRMQPFILDPQRAFELWIHRVQAFKEVRAANSARNARGEKKAPMYTHQIPFPVLFQPDYSLHLITEEAIFDFFKNCLPLMSYEHFKMARTVLHDTHYRGETWVAGEGYEDEANKDFIISVMTRVAAFVNDHVAPLFKDHN